MSGSPHYSHYPIHVVLISIGAAFSAMILLARPEALQVDAPPSVDTAPPEPAEYDRDTSESEKIRRALEDEQLYRQPGLSVSELARQVGVPEYRLRHLIHHHLGYRNFNALLHHYRIAEVCAALEDPAKDNTPVLTLALSSGYQSINPFNRAFRASKGMTPTEYRRTQQHTNSLNSSPTSKNA